LKKFLKNWSLLTISSFIQQALQFFVLVKIARVLEPAGYGIYTIILTTVGIGQVVSSLGLRQIIIREIARFEDTTKIVAKKSFFLSINAFMLTSIGIVTYLYFFENLKEYIILFWGIALLLSQVIWNIAEAFSFGKQEMQYSSIIGLISAALWFLVIIISPTALLNITTIVVLYTLVQLIKALAIVFMEWKNKYFLANEVTSKIIGYKELLSHSLPLYGSSLLTIPITQLPILFLGSFSGKAEVGYFSIGNRLIAPLSIVTGHLLNAIYPIFSKDFISDKESFYKNGRRFFLAIFFAGLFLTIGISFFGKEIVTLLFGQKYVNAIKPFSVQVITSLNFTMHSFLGTIFLAANKENLVVKLSVFNAIVIGVANFYGTHFGAEGLALSSFFSLIIGFSFHWYFIRKYGLIKIRRSTMLILGAAYVVLGLLAIYLLEAHIVLRIVILLTFSALLVIYVFKKWGDTVKMMLVKMNISFLR